MHDKVGTQTLGAVLSITPGEIHLADIEHQTSLDIDQPIYVLALAANGVPTHVDLEFALKWSTNGWAQQLACPVCKGPSRVLRQRGEVYCCARCAPRSTAHHRLKNCKRWLDGGKTTTSVVHELVGGDTHRPSARLQELAVDLVRGTMARAEALLPDMYASLDAADELLRQREREKRE